MGGLRFLGQAKVVGPGGDVLAKTWSKGGLAVADVDVEAEVDSGPERCCTTWPSDAPTPTGRSAHRRGRTRCGSRC